MRRATEVPDLLESVERTPDRRRIGPPGTSDHVWARSVPAILSPLLVIAGLAGCSDPAPPEAGAPSPSKSPARLPVSNPQPVRTAPSSSPPCDPDQGWTAEQQTSWLRGVASAAIVSSVVQEAGVRLNSDRRVCRPIPVQVEYFVLTWSGSSVKATSVSRTTIQADGSNASLPPPAQITGRDACTGAVVVVYTGPPPLGDAELPRKFGTGLGDEGWAKRIAAHAHVAPRQAPPNCPGN